MDVECPAFHSMQTIPSKYTCEGENISPQLLFKGIPQGALSLVVIVDDPDAPGGTVDHWISWNWPASLKNIEEGAKGPFEGNNSYGHPNYRGPCPPPGQVHRYFFKVYALDILLNLPQGSSKASLEQAMKGHILEEAELIGTYQRT